MLERCPAIVGSPPYNRCTLAHGHGWVKPNGCVYESDESAVERKSIEPEDAMSDDYGTPRPLFSALNKAFGPFTIDLFASRENTLVPSAFFTKEQDATRYHIGSHVGFGNPPYSRGNLDKCMRWVRSEVLRSSPRVVTLVPAYTGEGWWQRHVWNTTSRKVDDAGMFFGVHEEWVEGVGLFVKREWEMISVAVHLIAGRIEYVCPPHVKANGARYSSAVVVYDRMDRYRRGTIR
jgi:phage N-6-adenine-methyltransferase